MAYDYNDKDEEANETNESGPEYAYLNEPADKQLLREYIKSINIVPKLDEDCIRTITNKVLSGVQDDKTSQSKWMSDTDEALRLSSLSKEPKNSPLPQSANIKFPLIRQACLQFAARTYPELIQDGKIVKTVIAGKSNPMLDTIAYGISTHMTHQLLGSDSEWEAGMDKLLTSLPNIGFICKKTYYDPIKEKNCSEVCYYKDIILRNDPNIQCLADLRRITHVLHVTPNDIIEGCRQGLYDDDAVHEVLNTYSETVHNPVCDLYECHMFHDLDGDRYEEPYIATVHVQTNKLLRLVARYTEDDIKYNSKQQIIKIDPIQYFTDYRFLEAPDGSFMSVGFGSLMLHMNQTVNTILNQLIDAGTLANLQTGFIDSRIKIMGGQMQVDPGQWSRVKSTTGQLLKEGIVPIAYKEPSNVLYQLLGLLIEASKQLTSSTDAMAGMQNATNVPATSMLAMIEQGMKMFSAIQRRFYRGLKEEYQKIYRLNGTHLDEKDYQEVLGPMFADLPNIYKMKAIKIIPIADPNLSSDAQRLVQSQAMMILAGKPGVNTAEIYKRYLESLKVTNIETIIDPNAAQAANQPDPRAIEAQTKSQAKMAEVQIKGRAQSLKEREFAAKLAKLEAEVTQMQANSLKLVTQAQKDHSQVQLDEFNSHLEAVKTQINATAQAHQQMTSANNQRVQQHQRQQELDQQGADIALQHQRGVAELQQNQQELDNARAQQQPGTEGPEGDEQNSSEPTPEG